VRPRLSTHEIAGREKRVAKIVAAANVVLIAGGVLATAAWLYCIYYYGWTGERQLSGDRGIIFYYVCPAIVASLFFASLRLESSYKINLAVVCIALAVCFYGGELLLVVVNWIHEPPKEKTIKRSCNWQSNSASRLTPGASSRW